MTIDAAMLEYMRTEIEKLLPDTCNLLTVTETANGSGGVTQVWGTATAGVACRLDKKTGGEQVTGAALSAYRGYMLSLPHDTTITEAYRVEISGVTYTVQSVNVGTSWQAVKRVEVEKL